MSQHRVAWLAWSLAALSVLAGATGVALFAHAQHAPQHPGDDTLSIALQCVDMVVFACVGALIASRRPRNPVGWLVCMAGLLGTIGPQGFGFGYAHDSLARPTDMLPATNWAVWLTGGLNTASISLAMVAFQLFPTGRRASDGWRPVLWLTAGLGALATLAEAIRPGPFETFPSIQNPLGIGGWPGELVLAVPPRLINQPGPLLLLLATPALLVRLWSAKALERQQVKWVVYAGTIVPVYFAALTAATWLSTDLRIPTTPLAIVFWAVGWNLAVSALPISIAIAVLRYRLYDIDLIIRRTLVYGVLSALLLVVYWAGVVLLQQALRPLTAGSDLAIVASTLAVAALFQPARQRIQRAVDSRFYRQRYDAAQALESFSARLRDELDLEALGTELLQVTRQTMQPQRLSLWLRPAERKR